MHRGLLFLILAMGLAVQGAEDRAITRLLGSEENVAVIRQAQRVEACPLLTDWPASVKSGKELVVTEGTSLRLSPADAARFAAVLLTPSSYADRAPDCVPDYHLRLSFWRGPDQVDVDFCFRCDIVQFRRDGQVVVAKDFSPGSNALLVDFLRLFPDDPTLRQLKTKRENGSRRPKSASQE